MKALFTFAFIVSGILMCHAQQKQVVTSGIAEVNGTKLYYEMVGEGDVIVFVHGNVGDRRHWDYQFLSLSKDFKVIRYDVRGYGKSALPDSEIAYGNPQDLKALLDYLKVSKAHVCGLSMGSGTVVSFAIAYPEMCQSLIPIGPWAGGYCSGESRTPACDSLYAVMGNLGSIAKEKGAKAATDYFWKGNNLFRNTVRSKEALDHLIMIGYDYSFWGFMNSSKGLPNQPVAIDHLREINIPTLIVTAQYDLEVCREIAEVMKKEIPNSKLVSIENAGHCMNIEKPEEFNELLVDFINNL
jgi:3-oxoadipate enol-lactonase